MNQDMSGAWYRSFADTLFDPEQTTPSDIRAPDGGPALKRFNVYRNNVIVSLMEALSSKYPAVRSLIGHDPFFAVARQFAFSNPPASRLMAEYGDNFPAFLDSLVEQHELPWLGDVARIERARLRAYHAADAEVASPSLFASISPETLADSIVLFHPAVCLVHSTFPVVSIWSSLEWTRAEQMTAQSAMVTRPQFEPLVTALPPEQAEFFQSLYDGATIQEATERTLADYPFFDLSAALHVLLTAMPATGMKIREGSNT